MSKSTFNRNGIDYSFTNETLVALRDFADAAMTAMMFLEYTSEDKRAVDQFVGKINKLVELEGNITSYYQTADDKKKGQKKQWEQERDALYQDVVRDIHDAAYAHLNAVSQSDGPAYAQFIENHRNAVNAALAAMPERYISDDVRINYELGKLLPPVQKAANSVQTPPNTSLLFDLVMDVSDIVKGFSSEKQLGAFSEKFDKRMQSVQALDREIVRLQGFEGKKNQLQKLQDKRDVLVRDIVTEAEAKVAEVTKGQTLQPAIQRAVDRFYTRGLSDLGAKYAVDIPQERIAAVRQDITARAASSAPAQPQPSQPAQPVQPSPASAAVPSQPKPGVVIPRIPPRDQIPVILAKPSPQKQQGESVIPPVVQNQGTARFDDLEAAINDIAPDVAKITEPKKPVTSPIPPRPQHKPVSDKVVQPQEQASRVKPPVPNRPRNKVTTEPAQASISTEQHTNALGGKVAEIGVRPPVLEQARAVMLLAQGVVMAENPQQPYQITVHTAIEEAEKNQQRIDSLNQDRDEKTIGPLEAARDVLITEALVDIEKKVAARAAEPMTPMVSEAVNDFYKALNYMDRRYLTPELQAKVDAKFAELSQPVQQPKAPSLADEDLDNMQRDLEAIARASAPQPQAPTPAQKPVGGPPPATLPKPKPKTTGVNGKVAQGTDYASPSALAASASVPGNPKPQVPAQNPPVGGPPLTLPKPTGEKLERMERQLSADKARKAQPKQNASPSVPVSSVANPQTVDAKAPVASTAPQSAPVVPVASAPVPKPPVQKVTPLFAEQQPGQYAIAFTLSGADVNKGLKHCAHKAAEAVLAHAGASHSDKDSRTKGKFKERLENKIADSIMRKYPDFAIMSPKAQQAIVQVTHDVLAGVTPYNAAGNTVKIIGPRPERDKGNLRGSEYEAHLAGKSDGHLIDTTLDKAKKENPDVQESLEITKAAKYIFRKLTKEGGHHFYEQREGFNRQSSVHTDVGRDALADITDLLKGVADKKGIPVGQLLTGPDGKMNRDVLDAVAQEANNEMGRKSGVEQAAGVAGAIVVGTLATFGSIATLGISARPNGAMNSLFRKAQRLGSGSNAFSTSALEGTHADNIINRAAASMAVGEDGVVETGQASVYTVATQLMADKRGRTTLTPNTDDFRSEQEKYATYLEEALKDVDTQDRAAVLESPEFYQAASRELKGHKPKDDTAHPTITSTMRQGGAREEDVPGIASVDQSTAAQAVQGLEGVEIHDVGSSLPPPRGSHAQGVVNKAVSSGKGMGGI